MSIRKIVVRLWWLDIIPGTWIAITMVMVKDSNYIEFKTSYIRDTLLHI